MKIENTERLTQEECDKVNEAHRRLGFEFEIKPETLWKTRGCVSGMDDYEFYTDYIRSITAVENNSRITTQSWHVLDSECVELRFTENEESLVECEYISEIVAAFTTANATRKR
eukprot:14347338-Heterocapsa_arctica.AAC.1